MPFEPALLDSETLLHARGPVYDGIQDCLRIQAHATPRGALGRLFGRCPLDPEARQTFPQAVAEGAVARVLTTLSPEWTVLHALPSADGVDGRNVDGRNVIDHILIGPSGLYSVTTVEHGGRPVVVDGGSLTIGRKRTEALAECRQETIRAAGLLSARVRASVEITPLIVLVAPVSMKMGKTHGIITVLPATDVRDWLAAGQRVHTDGALTLYERALREQGEWSSVARVTDDTIRHINRFERLQREVHAASVRARIWSRVAVSGVIAASAGAIAVVGLVLIPLAE